MHDSLLQLAGHATDRSFETPFKSPPSLLPAGDDLQSRFTISEQLRRSKSINDSPHLCRMLFIPETNQGSTADEVGKMPRVHSDFFSFPPFNLTLILLLIRIAADNLVVCMNELRTDF